MRLVPALLSAFIIFFTLPASAQDNSIKPGPGQILLTVSATERAEVTQDLLIATLRVEKEGTDATALQSGINALMTRAVAAAKKVQNVSVSTGNYYIYPYDAQPPVPAEKDAVPSTTAKTWRGGQSLTLQGTDAESLLKLAGELQALGLAMNDLSYTLSPTKLESVKDSLMEGALTKIKARAERAARALGKNKTDLVDIAIDSGMPEYPRPMMMGMKAMDGAVESMPVPVSEPGQSEITLTVTARALLSP